MTKLFIPNNWDPRGYQWEAWDYMQNGGTRCVLNWHRRTGKDDVALNWTAVAALQRPGTYWHMLPEAEHGRKILWDHVDPHTGLSRIEQAFPEAIRKRTNRQTMTIELTNGSIWSLVGSDRYNKLVGGSPAGIIFSEYALADPNSWSYLQPMLEENGGWAMFIYTSRGRNHGHTLYEHAKDREGWFCQQLKADQTGIFDSKKLDEILADLIGQYGEGPGEARFMQEYFCSFDAATLGSYYAKLVQDADSDGRIGNVPYDPAHRVETWWDIGIRDAMAIVFAQRVGREIRIIDYYEATGEGFPHYAKVLDDRKYLYSRHIAPHDIRVREVGSGNSRIETAKNLGIDFEIAPQQSVQDGIQAVRTMLPRCWIDRTKGRRLIEALRDYHAKYDEQSRTVGSKPVHNWASNCCDAIRMGAVSPDPEAEHVYAPVPVAPAYRGPNACFM